MKPSRPEQPRKSGASKHRLVVYFEDPALLARFKKAAKANRRSWSAHAQVLIEQGLRAAEGVA